MIVLKEVNREVFCFCSSCLYLSITISAALSKCPVAELCGCEKSVPERIPGRALCFWLLLLCWHCVFYVCTCIMCLIVPVYAQHKCIKKKRSYVTTSTTMSLFLSCQANSLHQMTNKETVELVVFICHSPRGLSAAKTFSNKSIISYRLCFHNLCIRDMLSNPLCAVCVRSLRNVETSIHLPW